MRRALLLVPAAALLAGCNLGTQIDTLKPVAGDAITELNIAANDVLTAQGVELIVAPVCTYDTGTEVYTCAGTTRSGDPVAVEADGAKPETMTVKVGSDVLYDGSIDEIISKAAQR